MAWFAQGSCGPAWVVGRPRVHAGGTTGWGLTRARPLHLTREQWAYRKAFPGLPAGYASLSEVLGGMLCPCVPGGRRG